MVDVFGATSTTEEVLSRVNLRDKRILVTGVSTGLGVETARSLAAHGAQVQARRGKSSFRALCRIFGFP
jgi:NAD(P)-dependent dehydrogenase (short-subunit alcohol dehydrogenase family)